MHRDHQRGSGFGSGSGSTRKEWQDDAGDRHQVEAREHARQPAKSRRTFGIRDAEAERQIRELRARY